jgi:MFS family permease
MTLSVDQKPPEARRRWLALLISPVAWIVYFTLVYLVDETSCNLYFFRSTIGGVTAVTLIFLALTLLTLLACLLGGYLGRRIARPVAEAAERTDSERTTEESRDLFIGRAAQMLAALFGLLTVGIGVAVMVLPVC